MSKSRPISPFFRHVRSVALALFRARHSIPDDELKDVVPSRVKTREQQVREKYQLLQSPRLIRAVSAEVRELEIRAYLNGIDALAWMHCKMPNGGRSMYKYISFREKISAQTLEWVMADLRDRRLDKFAEQEHKDHDKTGLFPNPGYEPEKIEDEDSGKVTIYKPPVRPNTMEKDERGREAIRKRLAIKYRVLCWSDRHEIDEVFSKLYTAAPWLAEPIKWLWERQLLNLDDEQRQVGFPPLLLVGPPGCGKTHLAQMLGNAVGQKMARIDMSARSAAFDISGVEFVWRSSSPGIPVRTLACSDHANPLIVLDEIDKSGTTSGGDPVEALLPLLQHDMARDFACPFLQGSIDLSWISWIATANDLDRIPDPIKDRMKIFRVAAPQGEGLRQVVAARLGPVGADPHVIEEVCLRIESGELSLRAMGRLEGEFEAISRRPVLH